MGALSGFFLYLFPTGIRITHSRMAAKKSENTFFVIDMSINEAFSIILPSLSIFTMRPSLGPSSAIL